MFQCQRIDFIQNENMVQIIFHDVWKNISYVNVDFLHNNLSQNFIFFITEL